MWYDLLGKYLNVPVWHLLGGRRVDRVPVDYWMGRCTPEETARRTQRACDLGFTGVKMKCAFGDPIAERVDAVRSVAPDFSIVLDPNERFYDVERTLQVAHTLEPFDRVILESPVPQEQLHWYVELRGRLRHELALHLTSLPELLAALKVDAADQYNLLGSIREFVDWATIAHTAGCQTWRGTGMDLGVRDMSSVHAALAAGCALIDGEAVRHTVADHLRACLAAYPKRPPDRPATLEELEATLPELAAYRANLQQQAARLGALIWDVAAPAGVQLIGTEVAAQVRHLHERRYPSIEDDVTIFVTTGNGVEVQVEDS